MAVEHWGIIRAGLPPFRKLQAGDSKNPRKYRNHRDVPSLGYIKEATETGETGETGACLNLGVLATVRGLHLVASVLQCFSASGRNLLSSKRSTVLLILYFELSLV